MAAKFTPRAREAVDVIFRRAAGSTFRLPGCDEPRVRPVDEEALGNPQGQSIIVFTMATFTFKMTAIFRVPRKIGSAVPEGAQGLTVLDVLTEQGNLCCGAINRDLLPMYPCMGVSSPTVLQGIGAAFDADIGSGDVLRYAIEFDEAAHIHATLHLCPYAEVDMPVPATAVEEVAGELEMF